MQRREFVLAGLACALSPAAQATPSLAALTAGLRRWGSGEFRRWGFLVYEASLWASAEDPLQPPLALALTYKRQLDGAKIAEASVSEIRNLQMADASTLNAWGQQMATIFPDVKAGDRIVGVYLPGGARFFYNGQWIGSIDDPAFARAFFAIWLDVRTSAPELRSLLLTRPT